MTFKFQTDKNTYQFGEEIPITLIYDKETYTQLQDDDVTFQIRNNTTGKTVSEHTIKVVLDDDYQPGLDLSQWSAAKSVPTLNTDSIAIMPNGSGYNFTWLHDIPLDCDKDWIISFDLSHTLRDGYMMWGLGGAVNTPEDVVDGYFISYNNEHGYLIGEAMDGRDDIDGVYGRILANTWTNITITCTDGTINIKYTSDKGEVDYTSGGWAGTKFYLTFESWEGSYSPKIFVKNINYTEYKTTKNITLNDIGNFTTSNLQNITPTSFNINAEITITGHDNTLGLPLADYMQFTTTNNITLPQQVLNYLRFLYGIQLANNTIISTNKLTTFNDFNDEYKTLSFRCHAQLHFEPLHEFEQYITLPEDNITYFNTTGYSSQINMIQTVTYEECTTTIKGSWTYNEGTLVENGKQLTIKIYDDAELIKTLTTTTKIEENNNWKYTIPEGLPRGNYSCVFENTTEDNKLNPISITLNNILHMLPTYDTIITITANPYYYDLENYKLNSIITLEDENKNRLSNAQVIVKLDDGNPQTLTLNEQGTITWNPNVTTSGEHILTAKYNQALPYKESTTTQIINIEKIPTRISSSNLNTGYETRKISITYLLYAVAGTGVGTFRLKERSLQIIDKSNNQILATVPTSKSSTQLVFNETGTKTLILKYEEDPDDPIYEKFAESTKEITVNILPRTAPKFTVNYDNNIYGYIMPLEIVLKNKDDELLANETIEVYDENNTKIYQGKTDADGTIIFNHEVTTVGQYNWKIHYPETDPYTEVWLDLPITFQKDTPILTLLTDKKIYTDGKGGTLNILLQTSQGQPLVGNIKLTDHENEKLDLKTTNESGAATYAFDAFAGLRQFNAIYPETTYYNTVTNYVIVNYDINKTFTIKFKNKQATLPIDNSIIPLGLYDVDMKYLGTKEYGQSTNNQGIDVKKATYFRIISPQPPITSEAMDPVNIIVQLYDIDKNILTDKNVVSKINNTLSLNHVTDDDGCINRIYPETPQTINEQKTMALRAQNKVGTTDIFTFVYGHTRKLASCTLEVPVTWTKITPKLELNIPEVIYEDVPADITMKLYYTRFNQDIPIPNNKITFKDTNDKTLFTVTTDSNGKATTTYINQVKGIIQAKAISEKDNTYNSSTTDLVLNIVERPTPELIVQDITAEYNITCNLLATLKDEEGNPLPNYNIQFKEGSTLLCEGTTNNSGYVMIEYTPKQVGTHQIQAIFTRPNQKCKYNSTQNTFTLTVNKAIPTLELTIPETKEKNTFKYGTPLTIQIKLKHNTNIIQSNNYISLKQTTDQDPTKATTLLTERLINGELTTTINTIRPNNKTLNIFARYGESTSYQQADSQFTNLNIEKLDTYLVPTQQETYKKETTQQYNNIEYNQQITTYATLFYKNYQGEILPVQNTTIIAQHKTTDGGTYLGSEDGNHTLNATTNTDGIAKFTPTMLYKEGTIYYNIIFEESNLLKAANIPQWKINIIKGQINLKLTNISTGNVYAGIKKINPTDEKGIQLQLTATDNNKKTINTLPNGANPIVFIVEGASLYDEEGNNPTTEVFTTSKFPCNIYVSSGEMWNNNDEGTRDIKAHVYSHNLYQSTESSIAQVKLLERDTILNYKIFNKKHNQELPLITNEYGTGYSVTLPEAIYIKGTLKYKLVPEDIGYSPNATKGVTGTNYSRTLLTKCGEIYKESEEKLKANPEFNAQSYLSSQMKQLGLDNPVNLIRIGLITQNENKEEDTGYELSIVDGEFSTDDATSGFELNAYSLGGVTNVSKHSFIEVLYRNEQNFTIKGVKDKIELFLKKATVDITFNASSTSISKGSSVTFTGKVTWKDANGNSYNMDSCNISGLGLCIYINNVTREVDIKSDGTYSYTYTHSGASNYTAKMYFRGAIVQNENYYESKYSSTKTITIN